MITAHLLRSITVSLGMVLLLGGTGCFGTSPASRFYVLQPLDASSAGGDQKYANDTLSVAVAPVEIPDYLDRPQIVRRESPHELTLSQYHRWAEPYEENIQRVLAENLTILLGTDHVYLYPQHRLTHTDVQVLVEVMRFGNDEEGNVSLIARWMLLGPDGETKLLERKTALEEALKDNEYESLVAAQSRLLAELSRTIAEAINTIPVKSEQ